MRGKYSILLMWRKIKMCPCFSYSYKMERASTWVNSGLSHPSPSPHNILESFQPWKQTKTKGLKIKLICMNMAYVILPNFCTEITRANLKLCVYICQRLIFFFCTFQVTCQDEEKIFDLPAFYYSLLTRKVLNWS